MVCFVFLDFLGQEQAAGDMGIPLSVNIYCFALWKQEIEKDEIGVSKGFYIYRWLLILLLYTSILKSTFLHIG